MTYNGWSNYETWAAKLWMDNDEGAYHDVTSKATELAEEARDAEEEPDAADPRPVVQPQPATVRGALHTRSMDQRPGDRGRRRGAADLGLHRLRAGEHRIPGPVRS